MPKADNLPPFGAVVTKSRDLTYWNPLGLSRPVMGLLYLFTLCQLRIGFATVIGVSDDNHI